MRPLIAAVLVLAGAACAPESASNCGRLADTMNEALDAVDTDPSADRLAAFHDAAEAWRAAGCEE